ncbi:hypothetical protein H0H93_011001 [Arthromyces matolae]|nr:hypothetical protein H0H93_011001 [Arthromyces matolae]
MLYDTISGFLNSSTNDVLPKSVKTRSSEIKPWSSPGAYLRKKQRAGGSTANVFLSEPGWRIRGITRNLARQASKDLEARGVEMVQGDLDDLSSLVRAFEGAHAIFGVTDFWQPVFEPGAAQSLMNVAGLSTGGLGKACHDLEIQRGRNLADAAAKIPTLECFVYSAEASVKLCSKGKYSRAHHFDSKAAVVDYVRERHLELAKKMSTVYIGLYATNWKAFPFLAPQKQSDNTYVLSTSTDPDAPLPMIDTWKDTGYLVRALVQGPPNITLLGFGSMMSWNEYMSLWSEILGCPGSRYEQIDIDEAVQRATGTGTVDKDIGYDIAEGLASVGEFDWVGRDPMVLHPKDTRALAV